MSRDAATELVSRTFGMVIDVDADADARARQLRQFLVARFTHIIDKEFAKLPQLLYQVDVSESAVDQVFQSAASPSDIPEMLADLVMERIEHIAIARQAYTSEHGSPT